MESLPVAHCRSKAAKAWR